MTCTVAKPRGQKDQIKHIGSWFIWPVPVYCLSPILLTLYNSF